MSFLEFKVPYLHTNEVRYTVFFSARTCGGTGSV